jgi:mycothiol synthase
MDSQDNSILEGDMQTQLPAGYEMKPFSLDYAQATVDLFNAVSRAIIGRDSESLADNMSGWKTPGWDIDSNIRLVFSPEGQIAGYIELWDTISPFVRKNCYGRVHPDHAGRGIGSAMLDWVEAKARANIANCPPEARVALAQGVPSENQRAYELFTSRGYQHARTYYRMCIEMTEPPPQAVWPAGIAVRSLTAGKDETAAFYAIYESFQDHYGFSKEPFEEFLARWTYFTQNNEHYDPSIFFVAWDQGEVAGVCYCSADTTEDPDMSWVNTLGVRRPWRKQGLGLALLQHSFNEFWQRGKRKAGLGVDASSLTGAVRLYERAGMHVQRKYYSYELELRPGEELTTH